MTTLEELQHVIAMRGTKTAVEGVTASTEEILLAFATDTNEIGVYTNGAWVWVGAGTAITVDDTTTVNLTLAAGEITADVIPGGIDAADLVSGAATDGQVLTADGVGGAAWENPAAGGGDVATDTIWDAKGDLAVGTGADTASRLAVGANGTFLMAASGEAAGVKWDTPAGGGDVLGPATSADNTVARFNGTDNKTIQASLATVDDNGTVNIPTGQTYNINGSAHTHAASGGYDYILLRDEEAQGTAAGTFTSGAWRTRVLNTEVVDTGNNCTLASNQFTLDAGTYIIHASAPAYRVDLHQLRLQNISDTATICVGQVVQCLSTAQNAIMTHLTYRFTLAAQKILELQHICTTTSNTYGLGNAGNFATEVYAVVELMREK